MTLSDAVPVGRRFRDYVDMFALDDQPKAVLGIGDGPSSFNAEATALGWRVVSVDPIYRFTVAEISSQYRRKATGVFEAIRSNPGAWRWDRYRSPTELERARDEAMERFVEDFDEGSSGGRYMTGALPDLDGVSGAFDVAVCSHLLFLYSEQFDTVFHAASIARALELAQDVRIYPLVALDGDRSPHVTGVVDALEDRGFHCSEERVDYAFQRGAETMLRVTRSGGAGGTE